MGYKIQLRRGQKANLPILDNGEPGYAQDTNELYIGTSSGNQKLTFDQTKYDSYDAQLAEMAYKIGTTCLEDFQSYATTVNGVITDWGPAFQQAVNYITTNFQSGSIITSTKNYPIQTQVVIDLTNWSGHFLCVTGNGIFSVPQGDIPALDCNTFTGANNTSLGGLILIRTKDDTTQRVKIDTVHFYKPDNADATRYGTFINVATWRNVSIVECGFVGGDIQILINTSYGCSIVRCKMTAFNQAIWLKDGANTTVIDDNTIRNGRKGILVDTSVVNAAALGIRIINNYIESLSNEAIYFKAVRFSSIENNYFEAIDQGNTYLSGKNVVVIFDVGAGSNSGQSTSRNTIRNNANGATAPLYAWIKSGFYNTFIGDSLTIQDDTGSAASNQLTQDQRLVINQVQLLNGVANGNITTNNTFFLDTDGGLKFKDRVGNVQVLSFVQSGTTANRPQYNLYIGLKYYDTTLGKPIWCHQVSPVIWHDATGASV